MSQNNVVFRSSMKPLRSNVKHRKEMHTPFQIDNMKFYDLVTLSSSQVPTDKFTGKIWFVGIINKQDKKYKLLRMFCTPECAVSMEKFGDLSEYHQPMADPKLDQSPFLLIIPITRLLRNNITITKFDIEKSINRTLMSIDRTFGLAPKKSYEMHVSILPANNNFPEPSGKIFINIESIWSPEKISILRELLSGMIWSLDINDTMGKSQYMICNYGVLKKS